MNRRGLDYIRRGAVHPTKKGGGKSPPPVSYQAPPHGPVGKPLVGDDGLVVQRLAAHGVDVVADCSPRRLDTGPRALDDELAKEAAEEAAFLALTSDEQRTLIDLLAKLHGRR